MATESVATQLPVRTSNHISVHPLAPINGTEIQNAVALVRAQWPADTDLHFKAVTLQEPVKAEMLPYLEAEFSGSTLPKIDRRVFLTYYLRRTVSVLYTVHTCYQLLMVSSEQVPRSSGQSQYTNCRIQCKTGR